MDAPPANGNLLLQLSHCLTPTHKINNAAIVIHSNRILAVGGISAFRQTRPDRVMRMTDCYALPGFVDTHIYGAGGCDCMHVDRGANIADMSKVLAEHGVTTFFPTTQSYERDRLLTIVEMLAASCDADLPGAVPAGIHIEGPFISPKKRGAHPEKFVRPIDLGETKELLQAGAGKINIFTFAPELDRSIDLVETLLEHNVTPAMGHTLAERHHVVRAIDAGAIRCSHLFNGMEPLAQRKVGLAALALTDDRLWVELITDGIHIHPGMIDLTCRCIPKDKVVCISNSTAGAGLGEGTFQLGEDSTTVKDGRSELADGTLAGSVRSLDDDYRNLRTYTNLNDNEVAACFTRNPAVSTGCTDRGEIKPGRRADIVVLDADHNVQMTIVGGRIVYNKRNIQPEQNS